MSQYVYVKSEPGLWTVGLHHPDGRWEAESDHDSKDAAAARTAFLNGGGTRAIPGPVEGLDLRQHLAALVMAAIVSHDGTGCDESVVLEAMTPTSGESQKAVRQQFEKRYRHIGQQAARQIAAAAVLLADALLAELRK